MITKTYSATLDGIQGAIVQIESVSLSSLPQIQVTGLPGEVVKESRERVRACLVNLGFDLPSSKILVHLSPANIKKLGSHYDLPIALAVLAAESRILGASISEFGFVGELSLDGRLCYVRGALPLIEILVKSPNIKRVVIPEENEAEGALLNSEKIHVAKDIKEIIDFLKNKTSLRSCKKAVAQTKTGSKNIFDQVMGQAIAKRALQIALAGRHHLLFVGPPGVGKSMLSASAIGLLPEMGQEEFIEVLKVYSASTNNVSGLEVEDLIRYRSRPYRAPHHTISANGLLGGGSGLVVPGEASLAHRGVLFMDEFPEYRRDSIEGLREPLQSGSLHLNRVGRAISLPARFILIAAMNPCPCGMLSEGANRCRCSTEKKAQYRKKLSTPILDRMALMVKLSSVVDFHNEEVCENLNYKNVCDSIENAYQIQAQRFRGNKDLIGNGQCEVPREFRGFDLTVDQEEWMKSRQKEWTLSFRRVNQVIKVARTIADLEGAQRIEFEHLKEAWGLRCFDFYQMS